MELAKLGFDVGAAEKEKADQHLFIQAQNLEESEDYPGALKAYHEVIDLNPNQKLLFQCFKNMGNIYLKLGDYDAAAESYAKAQRIDSEHVGLMINFGVLAMQQGDFEKAKLNFTSALAKDGDSDLAWVGIALVHRAHGDFDLARACLQRALDASAKNKTALQTYYQWCEDDQAEFSISEIENYLAEEPNDEEVIELLKKYKKI